MGAIGSYPSTGGEAGRIGVNTFCVKLALPLTLALARHAWSLKPAWNGLQPHACFYHVLRHLCMHNMDSKG
jgi:hypothetical protein